MDQQKIIQFQMIEQEAQQLDQQIQLIEQHSSEIQKIKNGLDDLHELKERKILANIGRGIYIPAEITDKKLIVEIGNKKLIKKSIPDAKKLIEEQLSKLEKAKKHIMGRIEELQREMMILINEANKQN